MTKKLDDGRGGYYPPSTPGAHRVGGPRSRGGQGEDDAAGDAAGDDAAADSEGFWSGAGEFFDWLLFEASPFSAGTTCVPEHPKPLAPTPQQIADRAPINGHPTGQSDPFGDAETPQNGTKTDGSLTGDAPVNTNTQPEPNPTDIPLTYQPIVAPSGSGIGSPGTPPPTQVQLAYGPCSGGLWQFNGETWSKSSLVCTDGSEDDAGPSYVLDGSPPVTYEVQNVGTGASPEYEKDVEPSKTNKAIRIWIDNDVPSKIDTWSGDVPDPFGPNISPITNMPPQVNYFTAGFPAQISVSATANVLLRPEFSLSSQREE